MLLEKKSRPSISEPQVNGVPVNAEIEVKVMTITPDLARTWLSRGGVNRNISHRTVDMYARLIKVGKWKLSYDPIRLDVDGRVRDGMHRLTAIVQAHTSIESLVVRGVSEDVFDVIDTGRSRSQADVLTIHGYTSTRIRAAAVKYLKYWEEGDGPWDTSRIRFSPAEVLELIPLYPELDEAIKDAESLRREGLAGGSGLWAAILVRLMRIDRNDESEFVSKLLTGANLDSHSPILMLRNRLSLINPARIKPRDQEEVAAFIVKAWNAFRYGEKMHQLRWAQTGRHPESFPIPV